MIFLEDIHSKVFVPEHQLLNQEEQVLFKKMFSGNELSNIYFTNIMSRYYKAKPGDIFRIIRLSILASYNIFYRRVVNNSLDIMFIS